VVLPFDGFDGNVDVPGFPVSPLGEPGVVVPGKGDVPGLLPCVPGVVPGFVKGFVPGLEPWFVPGFVNGLVFWFVPGFVNGFVVGLPELLFGLFSGLLLNGLPRLVEVVGAGLLKPVVGCCCCVGPAVAEFTQRPSEQVSPMVHMFVHDPQFSRSFERSAHPAKQKLSPCGHEHFPLTHDELPVHGFPQLPQFQLSVSGSMQLPLQYFLSDVHLDTHVPAWHFWSCGHALPQAPQFWLSVAAEVQLFWPHSVCPASASQPHRLR
jgi:hypothetical protein